MNTLARKNPAAAAAVALVIGIVIAVNINTIAIVATHLLFNLLTLAVMALLFAQWTGGEARRKRLQGWMLSTARKSFGLARRAF